jgi:hypothetical protein
LPASISLLPNLAKRLRATRDSTVGDHQQRRQSRYILRVSDLG